MISRISTIAVRRTLTPLTSKAVKALVSTSEHPFHVCPNPSQQFVAKRTFFQAPTARMPVKIIEVCKIAYIHVSIALESFHARFTHLKLCVFFFKK